MFLRKRICKFEHESTLHCKMNAYQKRHRKIFIIGQIKKDIMLAKKEVVLVADYKSKNQ